MRVLQGSSVALALVMAFGAAPLAAQEDAPLATQAPAPVLERGVTEVTAERMYGTRMHSLVAEGDAEVRRDGTVLNADRMEFDQRTDEFTADGNVRLQREGAVVTGPRARIVGEEWTGAFEQPEYAITRTMPRYSGAAPTEMTGSGQADALRFEGENQYRLENATWSTCEAPPDWYIRAKELQLDYDRQIGVAEGATLVFKDTPILWWPWADFPLVAQRKSGVLPPTIGMTNKTGFDFTLPYYVNIAPNYDATLMPRVMSRRGLQLGGEFRYLMPEYSGTIRGEWLPKDNVTGERRTLGAWQHFQQLSPRLTASLNLNAVSDRDYFEDLSTRVEGSTTNNLLREGRLNYAGGWWNAAALVQSYQTLADDKPYRRVPQLLLSGHRSLYDGAATFIMHNEFVEFDHNDDSYATGSRLTLYPQIAFPFERAGYYITPKLGMHVTRYDLDDPWIAGGRESLTRSLPTVSVDSGLYFDRDYTAFGNSYRQTLEPRLFYVYVPYERQNDIPLFDTDAYDFGYAQIFSENRYSGGDRIADANQITAALTTRFIDQSSGLERFRAMIGQRYYFKDRKVLLPDEHGNDNRTDLLAAASGYLSRDVSMDTMLQYNLEDDRAQRFNIGMRYHPDYAKVFNISYRYSREVLEDVDVSAQWPIARGLYGVGRITRSLEESRITEALGGIEYDGGCWTLRAALHRFATDRDDSTNAFFIQLELAGLGGLGPNPVSLLRRSVPGYGKINEAPSGGFFGNNSNN